MNGVVVYVKLVVFVALKFVAVLTVPTNVGLLTTDTVAVPPTVDAAIGDAPATAVIVPPPDDPHALPVVARSPPVPVCTH